MKDYVTKIAILRKDGSRKESVLGYHSAVTSVTDKEGRTYFNGDITTRRNEIDDAYIYFKKDRHYGK
jgi:hypothetical protein